MRSTSYRYRDGYRRSRLDEGADLFPAKWTIDEYYDERVGVFFPEASQAPVSGPFVSDYENSVRLRYNPKTNELFLHCYGNAKNKYFYDISEKGIQQAFKAIGKYPASKEVVKMFIEMAELAEEDLEEKGYLVSRESSGQRGWRLTTEKGHFGLNFPVLKDSNGFGELSARIQFMTEDGNLTHFSDSGYLYVCADDGEYEYDFPNFHKDLDGANKFLRNSIPKDLLEEFREAVLDLEEDLEDHMDIHIWYDPYL